MHSYYSLRQLRAELKATTDPRYRKHLEKAIELEQGAARKRTIAKRKERIKRLYAERKALLKQHIS